MAEKTDYWMPLLIGNYLRDTQHLDATRHGCYLLWLMHYWTKGPLPDSIDDLVMLGRLRGDDAPSIAQAMLKEFFRLGPDGLYHQKRADIEKARWLAINKKAKEKATLAAKIRWNGHASSNAPSIPQAMLEDMHEQCTTPTPVTVTTSPLQKEQIQKPFSPAAGFETGELNLSVHDQAQMIATEALKGIGMTSQWVRVELVGQAELVLAENNPPTMDELLDGLVSQWKKYCECKRLHRVERPYFGAQRFFGEGLWRNSTEWKLKKGVSADGITV